VNRCVKSYSPEKFILPEFGSQELESGNRFRTFTRAFAAKHKALIRFTRVVLALGLGFAVWVFLIEPDRLVVHQTHMTIHSWPADFQGLRIAAISDIHAGGLFVNQNKLRLMVDMTNATAPDLILLAGDFVDTALEIFPMEPETLAQELKNLRARHGVFAVLGNHDWWFDGPRVRRALEAAGIRVLENDATAVVMPERAGEKLWIAGFGDLWAGQPNIVATLRKLDKNAHVVALTHNPDLFPQIPARVALTVAGHTHGGQAAIPFIGRPIVPSQFGERFAAGEIVEEERRLFVTTGIGVSILPLRFRVTPEISLLTIDAGFE
jgi:predicted MPP superfamily phosphohydrolase